MTFFSNIITRSSVDSNKKNRMHKASIKGLECHIDGMASDTSDIDQLIDVKSSCIVEPNSITPGFAAAYSIER
jgi:hypothetical protein